MCSLSPQADLHAMLMFSMAAAAAAMLGALDRQEQLPAASRLRKQELALLLRWARAMVPAYAALIRRAQIDGIRSSAGSVDSACPVDSTASLDSASFFIIRIADPLRLAVLHCIERAQLPPYAAAVQQLRRCVPQFLASLVPWLGQLPLPGGQVRRACGHVTTAQLLSAACSAVSWDARICFPPALSFKSLCCFCHLQDSQGAASRSGTQS